MKISHRIISCCRKRKYPKDKRKRHRGDIALSREETWLLVLQICMSGTLRLAAQMFHSCRLLALGDYEGLVRASPSGEESGIYRVSSCVDISE